MKKKLLYAFVGLLVCGLVSAGTVFALRFYDSLNDKGTDKTTDETADEGKSIFANVKFSGQTFIYDGSEHELLVSGAPDGTDIKYTNNTRTEVGEQSAFVILSKDGKTLTLNALLKIELADITEITFPNKSLPYNGTEQTITVSGTLPAGVSVQYFAGSTEIPWTGETEIGTYSVTAKLTGPSYNPKTLTAALTITKGVFTQITLPEQIREYNGNMPSVTVTGTLPEGTSVAYSYTHTNGSPLETVPPPGEYTVKATLTGAKYNTAELSAKLTVVKGDLTKLNLKFEDKTVLYDGNTHYLKVSGLPDGVIEEYSDMSGGIFNGATSGTHTLKVKLYGGEYYTDITDIDYFGGYRHLYIVNQQLSQVTGITVSDEKVISFTTVADAKNYRAYWYSESLETSSPIAGSPLFTSSPANEAKSWLINLVNSSYAGDYYIRIVAFPSNPAVIAQSAPSAPCTYTIAPGKGKPYPPTGLRIDGETLKWEDPAGVFYSYDFRIEFNGTTQLRLCRYAVNDTPNQTISIKTLIDEAIEYDPTGLLGSGNYRFALRLTLASDPGGNAASAVRSDFTDFTTETYVYTAQ